MPKVKSSVKSRLQQYVDEFKNIFTTDNKVLFCQPCGKALTGEQRSQLLIGEPASSSVGQSKCSQYYLDLCRAFVAADIPLKKVNNIQLRNFLTKYIDIAPPEESTLRKNYLPKCYDETVQKIRAVCENEKNWVSIDETTDSSGEYL
ncbi:hypothetical protein C0J52_15400 [Blattella germanica]|nr:hypothetical protein C0J52_15400 [Blattella germanica]